MITPQLNFTVGVNVTASAQVNASIDLQDSVSGGVHLLDGQSGPVSSIGHSLTGQLPQFSLSVDARAYITSPEISFLFYGVAGPDVTLEPYLHLYGAYPSCPAVSLDAGIEGTVGVNITVLNLVDVEYNWTIFDLEVPLASWNLGCGPQAMTGNLIENPHFTAGLTDWAVSVGTAQYAAQCSPAGGPCYANGTETQESSLGRLYQDVTAVTAVGSTYQVAGSIQTESVVGQVVIGLDYVASDLEGAGYGWTPPDGYVEEIGHVSGTQGWQFYESPQFTLPAMPADAVALWFLFDFNEGAGTAQWTNVSLVCVSCSGTVAIAHDAGARSAPDREGGCVGRQSTDPSGATPPTVAVPAPGSSDRRLPPSPPSSPGPRPRGPTFLRIPGTLLR